MINTNFLLNAVKSKYCIVSDYALATHLELSKKTISGYRYNNIFLGDLPLQRVAEMLSADECILYAAIQAERTRNEVSKMVWTTIYTRLGGENAEKSIINQCFPAGAPPSVYQYTAPVLVRN